MGLRGHISRKLVAGVAGVAAFAGIGVAVASPSANPSAKGINGYGLTVAANSGKTDVFTYTKAYYCDSSVKSTASSGCEAGATYKRPPAKSFDPLFITVPLGFTVPAAKLDCPDTLICIDHPGTIDLTRLEPALHQLPAYSKLTDAQLTAALKNFNTPGHDHFILDNNNKKAEWWDVQVVGVASPKTFEAIRTHHSAKYIQSLIKAKDATVVGPIPTNLFLFFAAS